MPGRARAAVIWLCLAALGGCVRPAAGGPAPSTPPADGGEEAGGLGDGGGSGPADGGVPTVSYGRTTSPSLIAVENALSGDPGWTISTPASNHEIEGYASTDSAEVGDEVSISVSAQPSGAQFTWTLYRLGWYGGAGARRITSGGPLSAPAEPPCPIGLSTGIVECAWPSAFSFGIDPSWVTGAYLVKLHRVDDGAERYVPLVVRDHRAADVLFVLPTNTWQAYNPWEGESLYQDDAHVSPSGMAFQASYDRPYGEGDGAEHLLWWQQPLLSFLERYGYDVTYGTNVDFERRPGFLDGVGALVVGGGHDEYWTQGERDQVDAALDGGLLSLDYFGANGGYWRVRVEPSSTGAPLRTVTCYKDENALDPLASSQPTTRFRDPPNPEPEGALFGAMYVDWQLFASPLTITRPGSWVFDGTGLQAGDELPGLVGYEFDGIIPGEGTPAGTETLANSPVATAEGTASASQMVVRSLPGGQIVFDASSIWFTQGLAAGPFADPRIYQITWNVLERSLAWRRPTRPTPDFAADVQAQSVPTPQPVWAGGVATVVGTGTPGDTDGPGATAQLDWPVGVAAMPDGGLAVADTGGNRIRIVGADAAHTVTTIAGNGLPGMIDGAGSQAEFRWPVSPVVAPDGTIYVADSDNHVIRRIGTDAAHTVTTIAGNPSRSGGFANGPGLEAAFNRPSGLTMDASGNLYVADMANCLVRRIANDPERTVTTLAGSVIGDQDGPGTSAQFDYPTAVAVDAAGDVFVLDSFNQKIKVVKNDAAHTVLTLAGGPPGGGPNPGTFADGDGDVARFLAQSGLILGPQGQLFLSDSGNGRIRIIWPGTTEATTRVSTYAGSGKSGTADGTAQTADLVTPMGLALGPSGVLYVTDPSHGTIRSVAPPP